MKTITLHEARNIALDAMRRAEAQREKERVAEAKYWQSLESAQHDVHPTSFGARLALSIFIVILLAVVLFTIGGR